MAKPSKVVISYILSALILITTFAALSPAGSSLISQYIGNSNDIDAKDYTYVMHSTPIAAYPDHTHQRRDDDSDSSSTETSKSKSKPAYDLPGIRVLMALGGIVLLNMLAICIHHVVFRLTNSVKSYRDIHQEVSPF